MSHTRTPMTIETLFSQINPNAFRKSEPSAEYTAHIQTFIDSNMNNPEALLSLSDVFDKDPFFPMHVAQFAFLNSHRRAHQAPRTPEPSTEDDASEDLLKPLMASTQLKHSFFYAEPEDLGLSPEKPARAEDDHPAKRVKLSGL